MIFKKKFLLLSLFIIIIIQTLLFANNKQKTTFKYFKWTSQESSVGKLINISFFSGLFISVLLNTTLYGYKKNTSENAKEIFEHPTDEEDMKSNVEIPPERDIRDAQPTISVNYRVIRNSESNNLKKNQKYSNNSADKDDWESDDNDW